MRFLYCSLMILSLFSCGNDFSQKADVYKAALIPQGLFGEGGAQFPIWLKCAETQDSVYVMLDSDELLVRLNIDSKKWGTLIDSIVGEIVTHGYLYVDYAMFEKYHSHPLVKDVRADSIYKYCGIEGLLREYVTKDGILKKEYFWNANWEYIRYLFFQNDIIFFYDHEVPCFYLDFFAREDAECLKKFLIKNCTE